MGVREGASGASADAPVVGLGMVSVSNSLKKNFKKRKKRKNMIGKETSKNKNGNKKLKIRENETK